MDSVFRSDWGRLFHNWERLTPDDRGWRDLGTQPPGLVRSVASLLGTGLKVLWTCIREAPEFATRRRRKALSQTPV